MIEGLSEYLDEKGMKSVRELKGRAVPQYREWGELDLSYLVVADIDAKKCIGCQLCYVACLDGAHQCIHLTKDSRVPYVDEVECIGCNLCNLACPVPDCITMKEVPTGKPPESWNDRVAAGTN